MQPCAEPLQLIFLDLMENFYGVDEEEGEAELQDAASMAAFIKANKEERTREVLMWLLPKVPLRRKK